MRECTPLIRPSGTFSSTGEGLARTSSFFSARRALGARLRARRQFAPAIHERTRSFFPTTAPRVSV